MGIDKLPCGRHPAKFLILQGQRVLIDADLAPLIAALDALGIRTTSSCQASCAGRCHRKHKRLPNGSFRDKHGKVQPISRSQRPKACRESFYLSFLSVEDGEEFLDILREGETDEDLLSAMTECGRRDRRWIWSFSFNDPPRPYSFICLIPRRYLEYVTAKVCAAAQDTRLWHGMTSITQVL